MGIGLVWLLRRVESFGSVREAAEDMRMSYVKALRILNRLERALGRKMVMRKRGGAERGGAVLTPFAREFIGKFERYHEKVTRRAEADFARIFGGRNA